MATKTTTTIKQIDATNDKDWAISGQPRDVVKNVKRIFENHKPTITLTSKRAAVNWPNDSNRQLNKPGNTNDLAFFITLKKVANPLEHILSICDEIVDEYPDYELMLLDVEGTPIPIE